MLKRELNAFEMQIMTNFMRYTQNTHKHLVSNSVGMALLSLREKYPKLAVLAKAGKNLKKEEKQAQDEIIGKMFAAMEKDLDIQEFIDNEIVRENIKEGPERDAELKKNQDRKKELQVVLEFHKKLIQEDIQSLDELTLYIPNKNPVTNEIRYEEKQYVFPLKEVLALVWSGLNDNHEFEIEEKEVKASDSRKARLERMSSFFAQLEFMSKEVVCHHGQRNTYVFVLNKSYHGIDMIIDEYFLIYESLRDFLNTRLISCYEKLRKSEEKGSDEDKQMANLGIVNLNLALKKCMTEGKAEELFRLLDPSSSIKSNLNQKIILHGSKPIAKLIDEPFKTCLEHFNIAFDPKKLNYLNYIRDILQMTTIGDDNSDQSKAVKKIKSYLQKENVFEISPREIEETTEVLVASSTWQSLQSALILFGLIDEKLEKVPEIISKSLQSIMTTPVQEWKGIPIAFTETDRLILKDLKSQSHKLDKNTLYPMIRDFFSLWYAPTNFGDDGADRLKLLNILIHPDSQKYILLEDSDLEAYAIDLRNQKDSKLMMDVYMINRIFLNAIMKHPKWWGPGFTHALEIVLKFVENDFNIQERKLDNPPLQQSEVEKSALFEKSLKSTSYPPRLLSQLKAILEIKNGTKKIENWLDEPEFEFPSQAFSFSIWKKLCNQLGLHKIEMYFHNNAEILYESAKLNASYRWLDHWEGTGKYLPNDYLLDLVLDLKDDFDIYSKMPIQLLVEWVREPRFLEFIKKSKYKDRVSYLLKNYIATLLANQKEALTQIRLSIAYDIDDHFDAIEKDMASRQYEAVFNRLLEINANKSSWEFKTLKTDFQYNPQAIAQSDEKKDEDIFINKMINRAFEFLSIESRQKAGHHFDAHFRKHEKFFYKFLSDPKIQEKIKLNDESLQKFLHEDKTVDLTRLEADMLILHRILLQALFDPPENWSETFSQFYRAILKTEDTFVISLTSPEASLISRIPFMNKELMKEYEYLMKMRDSKESLLLEAKPEFPVPLFYQIDHFHEWEKIRHYFNMNEVEALFHQNSTALLKETIDYCKLHPTEKVPFHLIPEIYHFQFLKDLEACGDFYFHIPCGLLIKWLQDPIYFEMFIKSPMKESIGLAIYQNYSLTEEEKKLRDQTITLRQQLYYTNDEIEVKFHEAISVQDKVNAKMWLNKWISRQSFGTKIQISKDDRLFPAYLSLLTQDEAGSFKEEIHKLEALAFFEGFFNQDRWKFNDNGLDYHSEFLFGKINEIDFQKRIFLEEAELQGFKELNSLQIIQIMVQAIIYPKSKWGPEFSKQFEEALKIISSLDDSHPKQQYQKLFEIPCLSQLLILKDKLSKEPEVNALQELDLPYMMPHEMNLLRWQVMHKHLQEDQKLYYFNLYGASVEASLINEFRLAALDPLLYQRLSAFSYDYISLPKLSLENLISKLDLTIKKSFLENLAKMDSTIRFAAQILEVLVHDQTLMSHISDENKLKIANSLSKKPYFNDRTDNKACFEVSNFLNPTIPALKELITISLLNSDIKGTVKYTNELIVFQNPVYLSSDKSFSPTFETFGLDFPFDHDSSQEIIKSNIQCIAISRWYELNQSSIRFLDFDFTPPKDLFNNEILKFASAGNDEAMILAVRGSIVNIFHSVEKRYYEFQSEFNFHEFIRVYFAEYTLVNSNPIVFSGNEFDQKILLSDSDLEKMKKNHEIDMYLLNRILLHAIGLPRKEWTGLFVNIFTSVINHIDYLIQAKTEEMKAENNDLHFSQHLGWGKTFEEKYLTQLRRLKNPDFVLEDADLKIISSDHFPSPQSHSLFKKTNEPSSDSPSFEPKRLE